MKHIFHFLSDSKGAVAGVFLLLILQAYCDLALPTYTSDILNIGLQQGGIEDAVPDALREGSLEDLNLFLPEEESAVLSYCYEQGEGDGLLKLKKGTDRKMLEEILMLPESIISWSRAVTRNCSTRTASMPSSITPSLSRQAEQACNGVRPHYRIVNRCNTFVMGSDPIREGT